MPKSTKPPNTKKTGSSRFPPKPRGEPPKRAGKGTVYQAYMSSKSRKIHEGLEDQRRKLAESEARALRASKRRAEKESPYQALTYV
eukprot:TRINITY_DN6266_c0_g1_i1.p2 TRINITY_DN6266_c0_g1~~TRINITY_DN6266_c0_g1_i1.p2  ORF type:complete len:86 (-),score=6.73 TRINITY_DN6266_c0_g1_i1:68-325(-)